MSSTTDYKFEYFNELTNFIKVVDKFLTIQPIHYDKARNWWIWNHNQFRWEYIDETDILNEIDKITKLPSTKSRIKSELLEAFKRRGRLNTPKPAKPTWVQFKDKIIDIETGEEFKATPEYFITNPIPWTLGKSTETPTMDKIFKEWVSEKYVQTLYEIIAYCLIPSYPLNRLFCFIGAGLNGKSKYLELIKRFVGVDNCATTELDTLLDSPRFETIRLHKKLVCFMGETNFNEMKKTAKLKQLTGGDLISYEYKGRDLFHDYNYAKILISTNNLPTTSDKTTGFYRRWTIIDFPNKFSEKKDILGDIPAEEYENLARKSLENLKLLMKRREFTNEGSIEERQKRFEDKSNPLGKFLEENTEEDCDSHIFKFEFKKKLEDWCKDNNMRVLSDTAVGIKMKEMGIETQRIQVNPIFQEGVEPKRYMAWVGIKWKE